MEKGLDDVEADNQRQIDNLKKVIEDLTKSNFLALIEAGLNFSTIYLNKICMETTQN